MTKVNLDSWLFVVAAAISACIGNILLKKSRIVNSEPGLVSLLTSPLFICALVFFMVYLILFAKALDQLPISSAYPVLSGIVFSSIAVSSSILLGERLSINQLLASSLIVAGIVIISRS
jgi:small multidrug resistance pump